MIRVLLTGGTGKLGQAIVSSGVFPSLLAPTREEMDITDQQSVRSFFSSNEFDVIIHCAALARMGECESSPFRAVQANIVGTSNLVNACLEKKWKGRFVYISTDGVYAGTKGRYSEEDVAVPYNVYGWTKLGGECAVRALPNFCIVRTSFFDPGNIRFEDAPTDAFSSKMLISSLARELGTVAGHKFVGTVNVGGERMSEYDRYKEHKPLLKPCLFRDVQKQVTFPLARDASMDCGKWNSLRGGT